MNHMIMNKAWIYFSILILSVMPVFVEAQGSKPVRMEIPVKDDSELYKVVPCGENGCAIIFLSSEEGKDNQMLWVSSFLDNKLDESHRFTFELPRGFILEEALYNNNHLVAFFYTKKASADSNFFLVDFNLPDSLVTQISYPVPGRAGISHFDLFEKYAIAGINTKNDESIILRYNLSNHNITLVSPGISEKTVIESLGVNHITGGFSIILRTTRSAKKRDYYFVKFNREGQPYSTHLFSKFENLLITNAFMHEINRQKDIIIGSYGTSTRTRSIEGEEISGVASTGFFSMVLNENGEETVNTYDFTEFDKFYRYLRRPTEIAPRRTLLRRERPSKDIAADHNLLTHEIFDLNGEYVFLAEAYYPEYRTVTTMVYDYYGRPYPSTYSVFEGFRYLTTFVAGFDENGELKWNNDLELTDALTQSLRERVTPFVSDSNNLVLSYVDTDRIAYKIIDKGQNLTNVSYSKIDPLHRHDKVQKESNSYILPWYKDYFLVYGYETVRNSYSAEKAKNIFYLSKMAFRL
jgi:hypothetical protein